MNKNNKNKPQPFQQIQIKESLWEKILPLGRPIHQILTILDLVCLVNQMQCQEKAVLELYNQ